MFNFQIIIAVSFLIGVSLAAPTSSEEYDTPGKALDEIIQLLNKIGAILINFPEAPKDQSSTDEKDNYKKAKKANSVLKGCLDLLDYEYPSLPSSEKNEQEILTILRRLSKTADETEHFIYLSGTTTPNPYV